MMAFTAIAYILLFSMHVIGGNAQYADQIAQLKRDTYYGGWPLAAVPCPAEAPVICSTGIDSQINQQCCPSGNTCFSWPNAYPYCCPTTQDCLGPVSNLPVCANSTWNMYKLSTADNHYFCCEDGQRGINPSTGYAGICQAADQAAPSSQVATLANQVGATALGASTTVGTTGTGATTTASTSVMTGSGGSTPGGGSSVSPSASSPSPSSSNSPSGSSSSTSGVQLGAGAIAGIAVGGAVVVAAIIFMLWKCCSRRKQGISASAYEPAVMPTHPQYNSLTDSSKGTAGSPWGTHATNITEVDGSGFAEMGTGR